jgi:DNA-binding response OmpR family regulator
MRWARTRDRHRLGRLEGRRRVQAATRVLVVDDDEVIRQLIAVHLRVAGFAAHLAPDGAAALEHARCCQPEVVILDAGMPGLDGWAVAARLRADPAAALVRAIVLVPGGTPAWADAESRAGVDACLAKPFDPAELIATVRRLARRRG